MIRIKNLRVPYDTVRPLAELAAERLKTSPCAVHGVFVVHKALDARRRNGAPIVWVYVLDVALELCWRNFGGTRMLQPRRNMCRW